MKLRTVRVCTIEDCWIQNVNIGLDLIGKCFNFKIYANEIVLGSGNGAAPRIGIRLNLFNYTAGTGSAAPRFFVWALRDPSEGWLQRAQVVKGWIEDGRSREEIFDVACRPWVMAFLFGLLHGFGFAGALASIGLPHDAAALALLQFNVGVEIGQLAIIAAMLTLLFVLRSSRLPIGPRVARWPVLAMGISSAYWFVERLGQLI